jgi:hypothetical protein
VSIAICLLAELERRGPFAPLFLAPDEPDRPVDWLGRAAARRPARTEPGGSG